MQTFLNFKKTWVISKEMTSMLWKYRALLVEQTRRDLFDAHAGQMAGGIWMFLHPIFLMAVYVFVFGVVFKQRIGGTYELPLDYTTYILSGLVPWFAIIQGLTKSTVSLTSNSNLIKQVVFPIEILPVKSILSAFVPFFVTLTILVIYVLFTYGGLPSSYLLLPLVIFIHYLWGVGIAFILSSLGVFVRDIQELITMFGVAGMFLLPVIYLPSWVPDIFKPILYANPFSYLIWCYQDVLYFGRIEHPEAWVFSILFGLIAYFYGARLFRKLKHSFGDVL